MIDHALRYAAHGWPVLALIGKVPPADTDGVYAATTDPDRIRRMFAHPGLNVGIALHHHLVVDVDIKHDGPRWLAERRRKLHGLTLTCKTGGGGYHFYFALPPGELRGMICKGVDLRRGAGQYVVAPPSIHLVTGCQYEWIRTWPNRPQPVPGWLLEQVRRPVARPIETYNMRRSQSVAFERAVRYLQRCDVAISGSGGHHTTFNVCLKLAANFPELDFEYLWILLSDWNQQCSPPWNETELRHKLNDALRSVRGERAA